MNKRSIQILQWNLNGFYKKLDELKLLISEHDPVIICLQETNFNNFNKAKLKNYNEYYINKVDCLRDSGGAAIYIKKDYPSKAINKTSNLEVIVATVKLNDFELNICNIYLPNQHKFEKNDIENIIN